MPTKTPAPIPVFYLGCDPFDGTPLGHATTERGALAVFARHVGRYGQPRTAARHANLVECTDLYGVAADGATTYRPPRHAWAVGFHLTRTP